MKIIVFILMLMLLSQTVLAEQVCRVENSYYVCNDIKNPSIWDRVVSYGSDNPMTFWIIFFILLISIVLLLNYIFEHKQSDRILMLILTLMLIILAITILGILVVT